MIKYTHLIKFLLRDKMYSYNIEIEFDLEISSKNYTLLLFVEKIHLYSNLYFKYQNLLFNLFLFLLSRYYDDIYALMIWFIIFFLIYRSWAMKLLLANVIFNLSFIFNDMVIITYYYPTKQTTWKCFFQPFP
jgi:hypothetical protein